MEESSRLIDASQRHNLTLVPLLDGDPNNQFAPPADLNAFAEWAGEFAQRYGDQLDAYIIWNEPNITLHWGLQPVNPAEYAALLSASADAIRANDTNALIVTAPLAPTVEINDKNLSDPIFLQRLYEAGVQSAFDVVAGKPYGFDHPPGDRTVSSEQLNFSRIILLREVMEANGDGDKGIWAGNWGWNALPANWQHAPSIWGDVSRQTQADWTQSALDRARLEWAWMGVMFLESWQPNLPATDPRWGFAIKDSPTEQTLRVNRAHNNPTNVAYSGFHLADSTDLAQSYEGGWRFSPDFGADISGTGDAGSFTFYGTEIALRVRRANYRARFYFAS